MTSVELSTCSYCGTDEEPCVSIGWRNQGEMWCRDCIGGALEDLEEAHKAWQCRCIVAHPRTKAQAEAVKRRIEWAIEHGDWTCAKVLQAQLFGKCAAKARWTEYEENH